MKNNFNAQHMTVISGNQRMKGLRFFFGRNKGNKDRVSKGELKAKRLQWMGIGTGLGAVLLGLALSFFLDPVQKHDYMGSGMQLFFEEVHAMDEYIEKEDWSSIIFLNQDENFDSLDEKSQYSLAYAYYMKGTDEAPCLFKEIAIQDKSEYKYKAEWFLLHCFIQRSEARQASIALNHIIDDEHHPYKDKALDLRKGKFFKKSRVLSSDLSLIEVPKACYSQQRN